MALYKLGRLAGTIIRNSDNASIPTNPENSDYVAYQAWVAQGNTADPADPLTPAEIAAQAAATQDAADVTAAKAYTKLTALKNMTPAQVQAWVAANVTNLAQAQDAIATLAIAVSILARRL